MAIAYFFAYLLLLLQLIPLFSCIYLRIKVFNISIFTGKCQIVFGRLTFSHIFEDIKDFSNCYFVFLDDLKNFIYCCLNSVGQAKNVIFVNFFGRLTFSRKNGDIKDFIYLARIDYESIPLI